jgi:hypothetical protein
MGKPTFPIAVVMERRASSNRWQSEVWEPIGVLAGYQGKGGVRQLVDAGGVQQWLHPGLVLKLRREEAEGYYLNVSTDSPRVFVLWRLDEGRGLPLEVTVSYNEGARWLDGGHSVDGVPMPPEIFAWVGEYVEANYRPEPRTRIKPRSFIHPKDRAAG